MPEILSRASILFKVDSRLRGNDGQECADYYETINNDGTVRWLLAIRVSDLLGVCFFHL